MPATKTIAGRRGGFTLIELIVSVTMAVVILAALWTLLRMYTDLFDRGQARVEEAQLARALLLQMADDLHAAVQDPVAGMPVPDAAGPQRRFGLQGTSQELRFDVLQLPPPVVNLSQDEPMLDAAETDADSSAPRVPELKTIYYGFTPPETEEAELADPAADVLAQTDDGGEPADVPPPGLLRREESYEADGADPEADAAVGISTEATGDGGEPTALHFTADPDSLLVPEVVSCQFRYFDGSGWRSQWNSLSDGGLPVAVEIALRLGDPLAADQEDESNPDDSLALDEPPPPPEPDFSETGTAEVLVDGEPASGLAEEGTLPAEKVYRLVVDLPGSPKRPELKPTLATAEPAGVVPPPAEVLPLTTPRIAPPRWNSETPEAPAKPARLPDQWMRNAP